MPSARAVRPPRVTIHLSAQVLKVVDLTLLYTTASGIAGLALILAFVLAMYFVLRISGPNPVILIAGSICLVTGVFCALATLGYITVPGTDWFGKAAAAIAQHVAALI